MVAKVNSVASEFRKVSDLQMADTTKRTIQENMSIGRQLYRMSDKTTEMMKENERLREREKELSRRMEIMEATERDVTRKNINNQRVSLTIKIPATSILVFALLTILVHVQLLEILREKIQDQDGVLNNHVDCQEQIQGLKNELEQAQYTSLTLTQQAEVKGSKTSCIELFFS